MYISVSVHVQFLDVLGLIYVCKNFTIKEAKFNCFGNHQYGSIIQVISKSLIVLILNQTCINSLTAHCLYKGDNLAESTQAASALIRFRGVSSLPASEDCGEDGKSESIKPARYKYS